MLMHVKSDNILFKNIQHEIPDISLKPYKTLLKNTSLIWKMYKGNRKKGEFKLKSIHLLALLT